jgi:hypothetical protein
MTNGIRVGGFAKMEGAGVAVFVIFAVIVGIGSWMLATSMDNTRITDYIRERGGRVVSINWAPFGKGWFGEKNARIYEVVYYDKAGNQHFATCKTSLWSGVYWTEDRITHQKSKWYDSVSPSNEPGKPLIGQIPREAGKEEAEELRRLREENARLRERLSGQTFSSEALTQPGKCPACGAVASPGAARCPDCGIALQ